MVKANHALSNSALLRSIYIASLRWRNHAEMTVLMGEQKLSEMVVVSAQIKAIWMVWI